MRDLPMAFKDNWPLHLTIALTGDWLDDKLAQDFWPAELFNYKSMVRYHLLKLVWVYSVSVLVQITLPVSVVMMLAERYHDDSFDWGWVLMALGIVTALAWPFAVIIAIATWVDLKRKAKMELESR